MPDTANGVYITFVGEWLGLCHSPYVLTSTGSSEGSL